MILTLCSDTTRFWPDNMSFIQDYLIALYSKIHAEYYKNTLQHYTRSPEFAVTTL